MFIEEAEELLENLNRRLLELERRKDAPELVHEVFRLTHSLKSEAALIGLPHLSRVSHRLEDVFERVRSGKLSLSKALMDRIFACSDLLAEMLGRIIRGADDSGFDTRLIFEELDRLSAPDGPPVAGGPAGKRSAGEALRLNAFEQAQVREAASRGERLYLLDFRVAEDEPMKYPRAYLVFNKLEQLTNVIKTLPDLGGRGSPAGGAGEEDDRVYGRVSVLLATHRSAEELERAVKIDQVDGARWKLLDPASLLEEAAAPPEDSQASGGTAEGRPRAPPARQEAGAQGEAEKPVAAPGRPERTTIRVETRKLNDLWQLIGELIINRSRLSRIIGNLHGADETCRKNLEQYADSLDRIVAGMQQAMMETRMVPISVIFNKFPRLVRDLTHKLGKEAELELRGEETAIDRGVVEALSDPLTHLIRNSLDHGLEPAEERARLGKPRLGRIAVRAWQEGGKVYIEISDDGRGLDLVKIRQKAGASPGLSDEETVDLIFRPGLSTKESVTDLSGRGVGMDVVATRIRQDLGGQVAVRSEAGKGTAFTIVLPLALNILNTLIVSCQDRPFAIPAQSIGETVKVFPEDVVPDQGSTRFLYRQETIPLIPLEELLGGPRRDPQEERYGIILQGRAGNLCLAVDALVEEQELVIKPIDALLNERGLFAGVSVLGDGRIVFVLDASSVEEIGRARGRQDGDPGVAGR